MDKDVAEWRRETGLDFIKNQGQDILKDAIEFSSTELKNINLSEFDELMLVLSNYYVYLHSQLGILNARVQYLEEDLNMHVAPKASKFSAGHAGERRALAISKDEVLLERSRRLGNEKAKLEMLRPVCDTIKNKIFVMSKIYDRRLKDEYRSTRG